jgi:hypothetical protein
VLAPLPGALEYLLFVNRRFRSRYSREVHSGGIRLAAGAGLGITPHLLRE